MFRDIREFFRGIRIANAHSDRQVERDHRFTREMDQIESKIAVEHLLTCIRYPDNQGDRRQAVYATLMMLKSWREVNDYTRGLHHLEEDLVRTFGQEMVDECKFNQAKWDEELRAAGH